jgi:hypothetical protein
MSAADKFNGLLQSLAPDLRKLGFSRRGSSFLIRRSGNWGLVNCQRSTKSTAERILVAVNIGVVSERLRTFFGAGEGVPTEADCHWSSRLAALSGESGQWWPIEAATNLHTLAEEIRSPLSRGMTDIERYLDDEALRDLWLSGQSPGLTAVQRQMNLVVLLAALGPGELVDQHIRHLQEVTAGKPTAGKASWIVARLASTGVRAG